MLRILAEERQLKAAEHSPDQIGKLRRKSTMLMITTMIIIDTVFDLISGQSALTNFLA